MFKDVRKGRKGAITASDRRAVGERMAKKRKEARLLRSQGASGQSEKEAGASGQSEKEGGASAQSEKEAETPGGPFEAQPTVEVEEQGAMRGAEGIGRRPIGHLSPPTVELNQSPGIRWSPIATDGEETVEEFEFEWRSEADRNAAIEMLGVEGNVDAGTGNVDIRHGESSSHTSAIASKRVGATGASNESDGSHNVPDNTDCNTKKKAKDMSWFLTGARTAGTGGAYETNVILSFGGHIAYFLWEDPITNDRGVLTPYTRDRTLNILDDLKLKDEVAMGFVTTSGLYHLPDCMMQHLDLPLLSAFVERWQPDTNTFHMPFGEMSILLHDVYYILRIPVEGEVCSGVHSQRGGGLHNDIGELLGISPTELSNPWIEGRSSTQIYKSGGVLLSTLQHVTERQTHPMLAAQGYLLMLLGSTIFVDKSCDRIRSAVNTLLKDIPKVKKYA